jgi:uncharacterized protein YjbI with pentapeptide repeats
MADPELVKILRQGGEVWNSRMKQVLPFTFSRSGSLDLSKADLRGLTLTGANLSGLNMYGALLSKSDLRFTNLGGADLRNADLSQALQLHFLN